MSGPRPCFTFSTLEFYTLSSSFSFVPDSGARCKIKSISWALVRMVGVWEAFIIFGNSKTSIIFACGW